MTFAVDSAASSPSTRRKAVCTICTVNAPVVINADYLILSYSGETATQKVEEWRLCMPDADEHRSVVTESQQERPLCASCVDFVKAIDELEDKLSVKLEQLWAFLKKPMPKKRAVESCTKAPSADVQLQPVPDESPSGTNDNHSPIGEECLMTDDLVSAQTSPALSVEQSFVEAPSDDLSPTHHVGMPVDCSSYLPLVSYPLSPEEPLEQEDDDVIIVKNEGTSKHHPVGPSLPGSPEALVPCGAEENRRTAVMLDGFAITLRHEVHQELQQVPGAHVGVDQVMNDAGSPVMPEVSLPPAQAPAASDVLTAASEQTNSNNDAGCDSLDSLMEEIFGDYDEAMPVADWPSSAHQQGLPGLYP